MPEGNGKRSGLWIAHESVHHQDYNVLFAEHTGNRAAAQIGAFEDTWTWDQEAARSRMG
jgi:hypothetical protein